MRLEATQLTKKYTSRAQGGRTTYALNSTNLELQSGQLVIITGKSGSGKSTLLHLLAGLLQPTSGLVELEGRDIYNMPDQEQSRFRNLHISVIPQGEAAIHSLTVLENIQLPCSIYGKTSAKDALALLQELDMASLAEVYPSELSGGELKRMSIARGIYQDGDVILADEPTSDLDAENSLLVIKALRQEADNGKAVLVVTHDLELLPYADVHYIMNAGSLSKA